MPAAGRKSAYCPPQLIVGPAGSSPILMIRSGRRGSVVIKRNRIISAEMPIQTQTEKAR